MVTKIEIKSVFGSVLFEYECEDNTIKKTVEKAVKDKINLSRSDLSGSNLSRSNLSGSNLYGSNLYGSNLYGSDLSRSDLYGSDLSRSDLSEAKNIETARMPLYCKWYVSIIGDKIKIGCKEKTIAEWDAWFSGSDKYETDRDTEEFKRIFAMYSAYKAYMEVLNG